MRWWSWLALVSACGAAPTAPFDTGSEDAVGQEPQGPETATVTTPANVLVVVLDDIGTDMIRGYGVHPEPVDTPRIDALIDEGVRFDQAIAHPVCSPARAALLTGLHPFRVGLGNPLAPSETFELDDAVVTLADAVKADPDHAWTTGFFGKWHVGPDLAAFADHPQRLGFDHFAGSLGNLHSDTLSDGSGPESYFRYDKVVDGAQSVSTRYATLDTNDDALAFMASAAEPFLAVVSYNAAHFPWHQPPRSLVPEGRTGSTDHDFARALVRSADTAIGLLLDGMDPDVRARTWIFVLSDNGSSVEAVTNPLQRYRSKGTLYRGGIRVPFVVVGPGIAAPGRATDHLVQLSDVFATVLDLQGLTGPPPQDSVSFADVLTDPEAPAARAYAYAEQFEPTGFGPYRWQQQAVRDDRYKVVLVDQQVLQLFDLQADPIEIDNLLRHEALTADEQAALDRLLAQLPR